MDTQETPTPSWSMLDGKELDGCVLRLGMYPSNRPALQAFTPQGEPECVVTVNLPEHPLEPHQFHARREVMRLAPHVFQAILDAGIARPTGQTVGAGWVKEYAEVWELLP